MKNSGTTIVFVIVCIVILLASYGIGLCIREVRFQHAAAASKADAHLQVSQESAEVQKPGVTVQPANEPAEVTQAPSEARPMPGNEGRIPFGGLSEEERAKMRQNWQNMSDEERAQERERRRAEMRQMREKMQNMSEEEREKYMAEMRQRFGDRQPFGRGGSRGQQQGEE